MTVFAPASTASRASAAACPRAFVVTSSSSNVASSARSATRMLPGVFFPARGFSMSTACTGRGYPRRRRSLLAGGLLVSAARLYLFERALERFGEVDHLRCFLLRNRRHDFASLDLLVDGVHQRFAIPVVEVVRLEVLGEVRDQR